MTSEPAETWAVIGGGMLGQALALRLQSAGKRVTLIESAPKLGGLAAPWNIADLTIDKFYHVILPFDHRLLALLEELGLSDEVIWKTTRTGFFTGDRLVSLNGSMDYLRLPVIGFIDKLRLAWLLMFAARIRNGAALDKMPVKKWLIRWCGRTCYERLWQPLLKAKLGENHSKASAAFIWASIRRLYMARKGAGKVELLGFVRNGGYCRILKALRHKLEGQGVEVLTGMSVERVFKSGGELVVQAKDAPRRFDRVVSTLHAGANIKICDGFDDAERAIMDQVLYQGVICASLVLNRPLSGNYLTYLTDDTLPFTAVVEMSSLTGLFGNKTLVYLPRYVSKEDEYWGLDDKEIEARFLSGLRRIYPDLRDEDVAGIRCARARDVMAVPNVGYRDRVPPIETSVSGLYLVNSAQIVDGTLNVDATLGVLDEALPILLKEAHRTRKSLVA